MSLESAVKHDWSWFLQHLFLLAVIGVSIVGGVYFVDNLIQKHDASTASKYEQILSAQVAQTKALQQQLASDEAENAKRDAAYEKTIAQLSQTILQRDANAKKQQTVDSSLDITAAAQRLSAETQATPGEIAVAGNTTVLDLPVTRRIVSDLDALPVVRADLEDTQKQLGAQIGLTDDAQKEVTDSKAIINSLTVQLSDSDKVCDGKIAVVKASERKSKFKWFLGGAGTVLAIIVLHAAGL